MSCNMCGSEAKYQANTAIGMRVFCSEVCYAKYIGVPVKEEGYYSLGGIE